MSWLSFGLGVVAGGLVAIVLLVVGVIAFASAWVEKDG